MPDKPNHPRENEIFLLALEVGDEERAKFLDEACGGDSDLRERVDRLLHAEMATQVVGRKPHPPAQDNSNQPDQGPGFEEVPPPRQPSSIGGQWQPPEPDELASALERYGVSACIGRGGMGAVYKGTQSALARPVAIKILPPELSEDSSFAERFRREALAMAELDHPNIVTIFDYGVAEMGAGKGTICYLVMEFVDGADLQMLIRSGQLSAEDALDVIGQICDALHYAHGRGYVHRDIKPANIFVTGKGAVKVGDFGLAKLTGADHAEESNLTMTGYVVGTPNYLAPENLDGSAEIDHRADIYSLGVMFYEMLTGSVPKGNFKPPSQKKDTDPRLDAVVAKAMEEEPELRYQEASEIRADLSKILSTPTRGTRVRGARSGRKKTVALALAGIAAAALITFLAFGPGGGSERKPGSELPEGSAIAPFSSDEAATFQKRWAKRLGTGVRSENSLGIEMVLIPPGSFQLGSSPDEIARSLEEARKIGLDSRYHEYIGNEGPSRTAYVREPFLLAATEITVGQFRRFAEEMKYVSTAELSGLGGYHFETRIQSPDCNWKNPGMVQNQSHPVVQITLADAERFCEWLSQKEGARYFLPTDTQWEYACRAGTESRWSFGNTLGSIADYAWFSGNSPDGTQPVGTKNPNPFGLHDMHGNVREWCARVASSEDTGILRGGAFLKSPLLLRSTSRIGFKVVTPYPYHGFRVAAEVKRPEDPAAPH